MNVTKVEDNYVIFVTFPRIKEVLFFQYLKNNEKLEEGTELRTTVYKSEFPFLFFARFMAQILRILLLIFIRQNT